MTSDGLFPSGKEPWQRAAADRVARAPVSDLDFAAWLDGRLAAAEAARVEEAMSSDPELRRAALDLAGVLGRDLPAPPPRLVARARALVGFDVERRPVRVGFLGWLLAADTRFAVQRGLALGAAVVVATAGFMMGGGLGASLAQERQAGVLQVRGSSGEGASGQTWGSAFELTDLPTAEGY